MGANLLVAGKHWLNVKNGGEELGFEIQSLNGLWTKLDFNGDELYKDKLCQGSSKHFLKKIVQ